MNLANTALDDVAKEGDEVPVSLFAHKNTGEMPCLGIDSSIALRKGEYRGHHAKRTRFSWFVVIDDKPVDVKILRRFKVEVKPASIKQK